MKKQSWYSHRIIETIFKLAGLYEKGRQNALDVRLEHIEFQFNDLPETFDNFTILYISDLHFDRLEGLVHRMMDRISCLTVDLCILGGDYRTETLESFSRTLSDTKTFVDHIHARQGIYAVLGNHDGLGMISPLKEKNVTFLINDACAIEKNKDRIWLAGIDGSYNFKNRDLKKTFYPVPDDGFTIFISHTPEIYKNAAVYKPQLCLCGHTHAGQIRLPYLGAVVTHTRVPREMVYGKWSYQQMKGYTSAGAGTSGIPVRFGCRGEVVLITFKKNKGQYQL